MNVSRTLSAYSMFGKLNHSIIFIICIQFFFNAKSTAQGLDSLAGLVKTMQRGENDSARLAANGIFLRGFEKILQEKGSFNQSFDSLKNISIVSPEDKSFRIYTWVVPHYAGDQYDYFGFLQVKFKTGDSVQLFQLHDSTATILKPESEKLSPQKWLGAVYYGVQTTTKSKLTYYTLFGWKGKNEKQTQKLIEVFAMNKNQPQFGYPLLKTGSVYKNRMVFTFDSQSTMTLHYDKNFDGIVFDNISQSKKTDFIVTGPDGTYDAFKWKKGKWVLYRDVDVRRKSAPKE